MNCSGASASSGGRHPPAVSLALRPPEVQLQNSATASMSSEAAGHKNTRSSCSKAKYSPMAVTRPHAMKSEASTRRWRFEHCRFRRLVSGESEGSSPDSTMLARCSRTASLPRCSSTLSYSSLTSDAHNRSDCGTCELYETRPAVAHPAVDPRVEVHDEVLGGALGKRVVVIRRALEARC
eukprot:scaffold39466_cov62-Phaeocystis_antarctica.AAC.7